MESEVEKWGGAVRDWKEKESKEKANMEVLREELLDVTARLREAEGQATIAKESSDEKAPCANEYDLLQANAQLLEECKALKMKVEDADKALFENKSLKQTVKALSATGTNSARKISTPMSMEGRRMFERVRGTPRISTPPRTSMAPPVMAPVTVAPMTPMTNNDGKYIEQIRHLQSCLDRNVEDIGNMEREKEDASKKATAAKEGMEDALKVVNEVDEDKKRMSTLLERTKSELFECGVKLAEAGEDIIRLRLGLEKMEEIKYELQQGDKVKEKLMVEKESLKAKLWEALEKAGELEDAKRQVARAEKENATLSKRLQEADDKVDEQYNDIREAKRGSKMEVEKIIETVEELEAEKRDLQRKVKGEQVKSQETEEERDKIAKELSDLKAVEVWDPVEIARLENDLEAARRAAFARNSEFKRVTSMVDELSARIERLVEELDEKDGEIIYQKHIYEKLETERNAMNGRLEAAVEMGEESIKELQNELSNIGNIVQAEKKRCREEESKRLEAEKTLAEIKSKKIAGEDGVDTLQKKFEVVNEEMMCALSENGELQRELWSMRNEKMGSEDVLEELKSEIESLREESAELERLRKQNSEFESLRQRTNELESERTANHAIMEKSEVAVKKAGKRVKELEEKLEKAKVRIAELDARLAEERRGSLESVAESEKAVKDADETAEAEAVRADEAEKNLAALEKRLDDAKAELEAGVGAKQQTVEKLKAALIVEQDKVEGLERQAEWLKSNATLERERMKSAKSELGNKLAFLKENAEAADTWMAEATTKIASLESEKAELDGEHASLKESSKAAGAWMAEATANMSRMQGEIDSNKGAAEAAKQSDSRVAEAKTKLNLLERNLEEALKEKMEVVSKLALAESNKTELEGEIEIMTEKSKAAEAWMAEAKINIASMEAALTSNGDASSNVAVLTEALKEAKAEKANLEEEISSLSENAAAADTWMAEVQAKISVMESDKEGFEEEILSLTESLAEKSKVVDTAVHATAALEETLEKKQHAMAAEKLEADLKVAEEKIVELELEIERMKEQTPKEVKASAAEVAARIMSPFDTSFDSASQYQASLEDIKKEIAALLPADEAVATLAEELTEPFVMGEFESEDGYYERIAKMRSSIIEIVTGQEEGEMERLKEELKKAENMGEEIRAQNEMIKKKYDTVFENFVKSEQELEEARLKVTNGASEPPSIARDSPVFRTRKGSKSEASLIKNVVSKDEGDNDGITGTGEQDRVIEEMVQTIEGLMAEKEEILQETVDLLEACKQECAIEKEEDRVRVTGECAEMAKKVKAYWVGREREKCLSLAAAAVARIKCQRAFMIWRIKGERRKRKVLGQAFGKALSDANEELKVEKETGNGGGGRERGGAGAAGSPAMNPFEKLGL